MSYYAIVDTTIRSVIEIIEAKNVYEAINVFAKNHDKTVDHHGTKFSAYEIYDDKIDNVKDLLKKGNYDALFAYIFIFSTSTLRFSLK